MLVLFLLRTLYYIKLLKNCNNPFGRREFDETLVHAHFHSTIMPNIRTFLDEAQTCLALHYLWCRDQCLVLLI
ncbi:unnamed protein product [Brugia pahangi]|uniref:Uncharacterized protein n=1 Tax=Brugia pahangi TaxID=6280 RepID=A0A3P7TZD8_BRUPA|nr:unnamed protein product [Brugia pahangi]